MDLKWYSAKLHALFLHDKDKKAWGFIQVCKDDIFSIDSFKGLSYICCTLW